MPTDLAASAANCHQVNLSWSPSTDSGGSGVKGYDIYRSTAGGDSVFVKQVLEPTTQTYDTSNPGQPTLLPASSSFSYSVRAYDFAGNVSAGSPAVAVSTPACASDCGDLGQSCCTNDVCLQGAFCGAGICYKTYGSAVIVPTAGPNFSKVVKVRYQFRIDDRYLPLADANNQTWKILFTFPQFLNPANPSVDLYNLNTQLSPYGNSYASTSSCTQPPQTFRSDPSLGLGIADVYNNRTVGAHTRSPLMFPEQTFLIDGKFNQTISHVSQTNLLGKDGTLQVARGATTTHLTGWNCLGALPSQTYRIWTQTATFDGKSYAVDFVMPDRYANYFVSDASLGGPFYFSTEGFYVNPGFYRVYLWGFEVLREGSSLWEPIHDWIVNNQGDAAPTENTWGYRLGSYGGHPVIEVSNDMTFTYARIGDVLTLP